ncbi:MAG: hypothetical protein HY548_05045 [Elusimicrobia bacterium]|nr:hypothetical protein [Elusimicrobiota bacterium]
MKRIGIVFLAAVSFLAPTLVLSAMEPAVGAAVAVSLKNGKTVTGALKSANEDQLIIDTEDGQITILRGNIDRVAEVPPNAVDGERGPVISEDEPAPPLTVKPRKQKSFFVQTIFWDAAGAYSPAEDDLSKRVSALNGGGTGSYSGDSTVVPGQGFRLGFLFPMTDRGMEYGWSLDYTKGPGLEQRIVRRLSSFSSATDTWTYGTSFIRLLNETQKRIGRGKRVELRLRGAVGLASASITEDYNYTGTGSLASSRSKMNESRWLAFSGEASASLGFTLRGMAIDAGVVYGVFPKRSKDTDFPEFNWTPMGFRLGAHF